ncbi:helix-turn-helix transcriptional regulator [Pseudonocardia sp. HH130629-09]|uniref:helix-turn-helix transcriptional regulator n=1 Tax=Pseudonocardia sp. HH130629-09 TaxID=1641402 RepID=UPI000761C3DA|nr:helix-turn-helix domain-containing protein [Pseudonocardia sp. HH130629-09]
MSVADFSVLSRVVEHGGGRMAQQELGDMLGWQRARLSRHLGRMVERGLVDRDTDTDRRRRVVVTEPGLRSLRAARPADADAVRRVLLVPTSSPRGDEFWATLVRLAEREDPRGGGAERGDGDRGP